MNSSEGQPPDSIGLMFLVSTAATLPVVLGMYVGQNMRDKIAPETFKTLVLIAVIAAGADLLRHGFVR